MRITLFICFMFSFTSIFSQNTQISPGVLWNDIDGSKLTHTVDVSFTKKELIIGLEKIVQVLNQMG